MKTIADDLIEEGKEKTRARLARATLDLFRVQFGPLSQEQQERIELASVDELETWLPLVVQAASVEEIIGES